MSFLPSEMQELERRVFACGLEPEALMEEAGALMAEAVVQFCPVPGVCVAVFGKGHNGGDALVAARLLSERGWKVLLVAAFPQAEWAPLTELKWRQAGRCETVDAGEWRAWTPPPAAPLAVLDGLLGIGAQFSGGGLREPVRGLCRAVNRLRESSNARVFALDLPTGLDGATGAADADAVVADFTLTVGFVKTGLLADGAERWVGRLAVLPLVALSAAAEDQDPLEVASPGALRLFWARRRADMHKGDAGRVLLVAGAPGTVGAAALAALGALRAGAGLVTLCVTEAAYAAAAAIAPLECMVRPVNDLREALGLRADALAIGPGLGLDRPEATAEVIRRFAGPAVVDADALNVLAGGRMEVLSDCAGPRLLTPHAGEMQRLDREGSGLDRRRRVELFTERWPVGVLFKGARTLVAAREGGVVRFSYNTSGNPGMASGGMGDVLSGVCASLLARGLGVREAGLLGAWLCGRSAEVLVSGGRRSEESLLASDVADGLGAAFEALRSGVC
jgi:NAD(P)H-hydrate epimerase